MNIDQTVFYKGVYQGDNVEQEIRRPRARAAQREMIFLGLTDTPERSALFRTSFHIRHARRLLDIGEPGEARERHEQALDLLADAHKEVAKRERREQDRHGKAFPSTLADKRAIEDLVIQATDGLTTLYAARRDHDQPVAPGFSDPNLFRRS